MPSPGRTVRVRFAPSPTGFMHLGNVRAALLNYLFALQKNGIFILRIEDTDPQRNVDLGGKQIMADLAWLGLTYQEGPEVGGNYGPYYQSERSSFYKKYLKQLQDKERVYRCFCTPEELEKKRLRQIALKTPPRYDRHCLTLSSATVDDLLQKNTPFIWRFKVNDEILEVTDLARGVLRYDMRNFSDFPITRQDGSFTFIFANFVDDLLMEISHVIRGEDHLSNTANQAALYRAFETTIPCFWHLPIICNTEGKKLSKRDFGFSLTDLKNDGFLPQAITNYLALIGGSFKEEIKNEIMDLPSLSSLINFDTLSATGPIRYDLEKLRWVNHKWIARLDIHSITMLCRPYLEKAYSAVSSLSDEQLGLLIKPLQSELITLLDSVRCLAFYFEKPTVSDYLLHEYHLEKYQTSLKKLCIPENVYADAQSLSTALTELCKSEKLMLKEVFTLIRLILTGSPQGPSVKDIMVLLGVSETMDRLCAALNKQL